MWLSTKVVGLIFSTVKRNRKILLYCVLNKAKLKYMSFVIKHIKYKYTDIKMKRMDKHTIHRRLSDNPKDTPIPNTRNL